MKSLKLLLHINSDLNKNQSFINQLCTEYNNSCTHSTLISTSKNENSYTRDFSKRLVLSRDSSADPVQIKAHLLETLDALSKDYIATIAKILQ